MELDVPGTLVRLLFVRAAWDLDGPPDLEPPSPRPPTGTSTRPDSAGLEAAWSTLWRAAARGEHTSNAPPWQAVLGMDGLDMPALREWSNATRQRINTEVLGQGRPPRRTILASRSLSGKDAGLSSIVIIPVDGPYAARVAPHRLVVSETTFADDSMWAGALAAGE
ncbi:hypothetical protein [Sanguibacter antarcticus]|nr:hypothetical protein [Sanguibacter antarcticus]